jgi:hypothetical protein
MNHLKVTTDEHKRKKALPTWLAYVLLVLLSFVALGVLRQLLIIVLMAKGTGGNISQLGQIAGTLVLGWLVYKGIVLCKKSI